MQYSATIVAMLYITPLWLTYFITGSLYHVSPFIYFTYSPPPTSGTIILVSVYLSLAFCLVWFCFLDSIYKWDYTVFVFICHHLIIKYYRSSTQNILFFRKIITADVLVPGILSCEVLLVTYCWASVGCPASYVEVTEVAALSSASGGSKVGVPTPLTPGCNRNLQ